MEHETKQKKVAIVGGGVSGLSAAWHLKTNSSFEVHLFEKEDRLGGHAHTVTVGDEAIDVDIGFMVFNSGEDGNYPNMTSWFKKMGIEEEDSDMSLSVSLDGGKSIEWNSDGLNGLFANRWQILSRSYHTCLSDMLRFNREASDILRLPEDDPRRIVTTGQYLRDQNYSQAFCTNYLLPMMAALWSASIEDVLQFPAEQLIGFLCNHKMLQLFERPQWKTVKGRSQQYTNKMQELLGEKANVKTPITSMKKLLNGGTSYELFSQEKSVGVFDHVIFACHPPTAQKILSNIVEPEVSNLLHQIEYADNVVYVHSDPKLMPTRQRAWASWNCLGKSALISKLKANKKSGGSFEGGESGFGSTIEKEGAEENQQDATLALEGEEGRMKAVYVTYWLNRLQNLKTDQNYFVSLNPHVKPETSLTHKRLLLAHPQFNPQTLRARKSLIRNHQGKEGIWFCGAWEGYGFHEDGCRSGFQVATQLSEQPLPWASPKEMVLPPPDLSRKTSSTSILTSLYRGITRDLPVSVCKRFIIFFLKKAVVQGRLRLKFNDGTILTFGDGSPCGVGDQAPVTLRIFDPWFFVKTALEYDLGLARSYMAGHYVVEPLENSSDYDDVLRPAANESNQVLGDPSGLTRLFLLLIGNRDRPELYKHRKAGHGKNHSNAMTNASGLLISKIGSFLNFLRYKLTMDNSERGGSLKNIHAHYDLSNDLFTTFLDRETYMYSSAIYDAVKSPSTRKLIFGGSLEEAQWRKLDTLLDRAQIEPGMSLLDIGFGWGGLSLHAAKKYGCQVVGITLSVEQKALAEQRVRNAGLTDKITFEVCDYRTFARRPENRGRFDRIVSCEMIEAVGHEHLGEFFWAVEQLLNPSGVLVMEAITTPEMRYETYVRSTDFINTIIFPGSCCPSLHALVDAAYHNSCLTLEHVSNIGLHYARTLAEWRRRFNAAEQQVRKLGFDDVFLRVWNYYLTYCEAGFHSQTEHCLVLVFARQGCQAIQPLAETRAVVQAPAMTDSEVKKWFQEKNA